jgi:hypothetical protein
MPFVDIVSTAGPARVWCNISTPTQTEADRIDPARPCLVLLVRRLLSFPSPSDASSRADVLPTSDLSAPRLLRLVHLASYVTCRSPLPSNAAQQPDVNNSGSPASPAQLLDPDLRRFNVIAMDARMHGRTEGLVKENFDFNVRRRSRKQVAHFEGLTSRLPRARCDLQDAAEDVYQVLVRPLRPFVCQRPLPTRPDTCPFPCPYRERSPFRLAFSSASAWARLSPSERRPSTQPSARGSSSSRSCRRSKCVRAPHYSRSDQAASRTDPSGSLSPALTAARGCAKTRLPAVLLSRLTALH